MRIRARLFIKKLLSCALLCALLPGMALGESIRSKASAPERVQGVYRSGTGHTEVILDARVIVPEVSRVPIIEVKRRTFRTDEMLAIADCLLGEGNYDPPSIDIASLAAAGRNDEPSAWILYDHDRLRYVSFNQRRLHDGTLSYCSMQSYPRQNQRIGKVDFGAPYYFMHHGVVLSDARDQAVSIAALVAPHMALVAEGCVDGNMFDYSETWEEASGSGWLFCFSRVVEGIPVSYTNNDCNSIDSAQDLQYINPFPYESLRIIIAHDGSVWLYYTSPCELGRTLNEDARLLPFSQILDIAGIVLPLKFAYGEKYLNMRGQDKTRLSVDRIVLSFMRVQQRSGDVRFALSPVWDFMSAQAPDESLLTLSAIDGTVIERGFGY